MKPFPAGALAVFVLLTTSALAQSPSECAPGWPAGFVQGPRPLTEGGLRNLIAFARLLGYVRHFHPSDQAAAADWDRLAVEGVRRIEACDGPEQLAGALAAFFRPVAPTVQVFPTGSQPTPPTELAPAAAANLRVVSWRHLGAGQVALPIGKYESIYESKRVSAPTSSIQPFTGGPVPAHIFSADLGAGVSARVPLKLYTDMTGVGCRLGVRWLGCHVRTVPHGSAPVADDKSLLSANDRSTRLAAVALAWNVFQHFYPYFDVVNTDWPGALATALTGAATDDGERAFADTLGRLVATLHDGHGEVIHPVLSREREAQLPLVWAMVEGKLVVTRVLPEAAAVGLAAGDVVTEIDGQATDAAIMNASQLQAAATPQFLRYRVARALRMGPVDSVARLKVQGLNGTQREVALRRTKLNKALDDLRPGRLAQLEAGIVYFNLGGSNDADLKAALPKIAEAKAVIFDMRGYPFTHDYLRHLSAATLQSPIWQIAISALPDHLGSAEHDMPDRWIMPPQSPKLHGRAIFLIDGRAISYAESVMGIVEHYKIADIVGEPTAGTNGNVNLFRVPGGFELAWTGMRVLKHDGSRHHGVGILPTHPVQRTIKGVAEGRDEILEKALELARRPR